MFLCLCGALVSVLVWRRLHDRQLGDSVRGPAPA
jgi:putative membrane protein